MGKVSIKVRLQPESKGEERVSPDRLRNGKGHGRVEKRGTDSVEEEDKGQDRDC